MGKAELFSYLSAFVTIVVALSVTNILQSASRLIQSRRHVRWDMRPIFFAVIVFIALVSEFFSVWLNLAVDRISMMRLLWLITIPALFSILAYVALPNEVPESGLDLTEFFYREKRLWALLLGLITMLDFVRSCEGWYRKGASMSQILATSATAVPMLAGPALIGLTMLCVARRRGWTIVALTIIFAWVVATTGFASIVLPPGR